MVRRVEHCLTVGLAAVGNLHGVVGCQSVLHFNGQCARVVFVAVRADMCERDRRFVAVVRLFHIKQYLMVALCAAVQRVCAVVLIKCIRYAVNGERCAADAVCVAADERALKVGAEVFLERGVAKHDIAELTGLVRC